MALKNLGSLRPETDSDRNVGAKVTEADVAELRSRAAAFNTPGEVLTPQGLIHTTNAAKTRGMLQADAASSGIAGAFTDWLKGQTES